MPPANRAPYAGRIARLALNVLPIAGLLACDTNVIGRFQATETGDLSNSPASRSPWDADIVDACGDRSELAVSDGDILRSPYLQRTQHDSTWIMWVSEEDDPESVIVTSTDGTVVARVEGREDDTATRVVGRQLVASIAGLQPSTIYCYELEDDEGAIVDGAGFRTAPAPGSSAPVRFVTMGDLGKRSDEQYAVLDQLATVEFDLALINGDVAYETGRLEDFERNFFSVYAELLRSVPFFVASGNHDYKTNDAAPYREVFALFENGGPEGRERWFSFDWGNVHFVLLDTKRAGLVQAAWLDADLAANELPWVVVTGHYPAFSSGSHGNNADVQRYFVPLFEKHQVALVIAGHDHNYERTVSMNGVTYLVTGAGGRGTRAVGTSYFTAFSHQVTHFTYIVIHGDTLALHAIDATGAEFDTLVLTL